ncbi:MAG TPA: hypothetical protein VJC09_00580 [Candidatus Saccharimonadales bacterium]|nr:hypothetical protein [Candidatus Saccharimonadales bacterium]
MKDGQSPSSITPLNNGVVLEEINDKLERILEATDTLKDVPADIRDIKERLVTVESDVKTIKAVVTDQSQNLKTHEIRITHLEQAA